MDPTGIAPPRRGMAGWASRLLLFYAVLAAIVVVVVVLVVHKGQSETAQPIIAGGYDVSGPNACIGAPPASPGGLPLPSTAPGQAAAAGPSFNLVQSGQFVNINSTSGGLGGKLRLAEPLDNGGHELTGTVSCVNGQHLAVDAVAIGGVGGTLSGTLGGEPFTAALKRDPPDPGSPNPRVPGAIAGLYSLSPRSTCFGGTFTLKSAGSGTYDVASKTVALSGTLAYNDKSGALSGDIACVKGGSARVTASANDLNLNNVTVIPLQVATPVPTKPGATPPPKPVLTTPTGLGPGGEKFTAIEQRTDFNHLVAAFILAIAIVMVIARLFGVAAVKVGQPRVMGEVIAGICLGPSLFGWLAPGLQSQLFTSDILNTFGIVANVGLIFYMFVVGLELDRKQLKGRVTQAAMISNASIALPMICGLAVALPLYRILGPHKKFVAFALFIGVSMSITAFPVLARILSERRMLKRPVGALAVGCAAIDDVSAWF